ncbi:hypothetical protein BLNAU_8288 [Blattamonas nauphoetae]|uniref:DDE Tnp4 domain-containing protein n=1 Tax=Blattamonas nauphoetae TaxID=2049346 RepID=A0ABQ9XYV7_9EUKA|nr:hypothetical protein BLNAU_8288 [Blattamonas nauphoetae]
MPKLPRPRNLEEALNRSENIARNRQRVRQQYENDRRQRLQTILEYLKSTAQNPNNLCLRQTGFTEEGLESIIAIVDHLPRSRIGRPSIIKNTADQIFLVLSFFHTASFHVVYMSTMHLVKGESTVWRVLWQTIEYLNAILTPALLTQTRDRDPAIPDIALVFDCTVVRIPVPRDQTRPVDTHYSGKHKFHCVKWNCGVNVVTGRCATISRPAEGAVHDWMVHQTHWPEITRILGEERYMADSAYVGGRALHNAIITDAQDDGEHTTDRVIVERFFGRLKSLFRILQGTWKHTMAKLYSVFHLCVSRGISEKGTKLA